MPVAFINVVAKANISFFFNEREWPSAYFIDIEESLKTRLKFGG